MSIRELSCISGDCEATQFLFEAPGMTEPYEAEPTRETIDTLTGPAVIEFGTNWCGFCKAAQPVIEAAFANHPQIRHIKVEDGKGRPLGRAFRVKLWPTLIFLRDGQEVARVVRPNAAREVSDGLRAITN
jgi:thioredoxin 1